MAQDGSHFYILSVTRTNHINIHMVADIFCPLRKELLNQLFNIHKTSIEAKEHCPREITQMLKKQTTSKQSKMQLE